MQYEIVYDSQGILEPYLVIQRDVYLDGPTYSVHSKHDEVETAQLVKEALEAREAKANG